MIYGKKNLAYICALTMSASLVSCGPKTADKIGEAQLCLDKATQATAATCLEKIEGIDTPAANVMRCSAGFIEEGFTQPTRFKSAFDALSQQANGATNTLTFLSFIAFSSKGTSAENTALATATYASCLKSNAKGLTLLGSMAMTATVISGGLTVANGTDIKTAIGALIASGTDESKAAIGSAVIATFASSCGGDAPANQGLCDQLTSYGVGTSSDPLTTGAAVLANWNTLNPI
jgi:hypothetical protein